MVFHSFGYYCKQNCFLNFLFGLFTDDVQRCSWSCVLAFYPELCWICSLVLALLFVGFIGIFWIWKHAICKYSFNSYFPIWMSFVINFSCQIAPARTSSTVLNGKKTKMPIFTTAIQQSTESNGFCRTFFVYSNSQTKASGLIKAHIFWG